VNNKSERIARLVEGIPAGGLDPYFLGYIEQFNRGLFYEAHDVLEQLWLKDRQGPNGSFYKGLIQLAGAFVHLRRERLRPAAALFKLAEANLQKYPARHEHLALPAILILIHHWQRKLEESDFALNPLLSEVPPRLHLEN
jgi:predicted metal-dependent hydrolase